MNPPSRCEPDCSAAFAAHFGRNCISLVATVILWCCVYTLFSRKKYSMFSAVCRRQVRVQSYAMVTFPRIVPLPNISQVSSLSTI